MSIYSNVTEEDLISLRKLAEQQENQRAEKIENRILKKTHDIKLAESLSPITKKLEDVNKSTQELGEIDKKSQPNTPQLAIEYTHTALHIENEKIQPGVIYDTSLENTLSNMKNDFGFLMFKKQMMVKCFGMDFELKKRVVINLKLTRRFIIYLPVFKKY